MVARYGIPPPSPALGRSKVHHRLRLSRHERLRFCLALAASFTACLSLLLLVIFVSSPVRFPDSPDEYQIRRVTPESDTPSSTTAKPLSSLWAPYSPYHPAGNYEASIREGRVLPQVNIVRCFFRACRLTHHSRMLRYSSNATEPDIQLPERPSQS